MTEGAIKNLSRGSYLDYILSGSLLSTLETKGHFGPVRLDF
jgi:hypothetical protein